MVGQIGWGGGGERKGGKGGKGGGRQAGTIPFPTWKYEMRWLNSSVPDFWDKASGFVSATSHNNPWVLQDHCVIL